MTKKLTMIELQMKIAQLKQVAQTAMQNNHTYLAAECVKAASVYSRRVARMKARGVQV